VEDAALRTIFNNPCFAYCFSIIYTSKIKVVALCLPNNVAQHVQGQAPICHILTSQTLRYSEIETNQ
jgi:hypothetical protein